MKKPNKELQMIIHDLIKNHTVSNNDLINEREEIINHIKLLYEQIDKLDEDNEKEFLEELNQFGFKNYCTLSSRVKKEIENLSKLIDNLKKIPQPEQRT